MENEVKKIIEQFEDFIDGVRVLILMHRKKEGGKDGYRNNLKRISRNIDEFKEILYEFLQIIRKNSDIPYRIYSTVNARNVGKAIRNFKLKQLNNDYDENIIRDNFYLDIKNRFVSSLMQRSSKDESNFLLDIDTNEGEDIVLIERKLSQITRNYIKYKTKNGYHIISQPFNPKLISCDVNPDGLMLLKY